MYFHYVQNAYSQKPLGFFGWEISEAKIGPGASEVPFLKHIICRVEDNIFLYSLGSAVHSARFLHLLML